MILLLVFFTFGCNGQGNITSPKNETQKTRGLPQQAGFEYITNGQFFHQLAADGREIWFDKWYTGDTENFIIKKKEYSKGLGIHEVTIEGTEDTRDYAFVEFEILEGKYSRVSGTFGFDESTKVKADSKLIAYSNGIKIYESPVISSSLNSVEVKFVLPQDAFRISLRFETGIVNGMVPRIVFANSKVERAK